MNWYLKALKQYADFSGRARRKEYWMFTLFNILALIVATIVDSIVGTNIEPMPYGLFYILYALAMIVPGLAVTVRRLHDQNKSGAWFFIIFVPLIGSIWLLVLVCTEGTAGENKYGPDPKGEQSSMKGDALDSHLAS